MAKKIPQINASSMADISFLLLIFFLVTTSMDVNQGLARRLPAPIPRFADLFLVWNYILLGLVVLVTIGVVVVEFCKNWKDNRRKAYATLGVVCAFAALACLCWFIGSPEKINIIGYEGTDNQGFWAQLSDAVIYGCYILITATIGTMIWGIIHTKRLK